MAMERGTVEGGAGAGEGGAGAVEGGRPRTSAPTNGT